MKAISPFALGATLYMPATRDDILDVVLGTKISDLRSLVVCLEDAVAATDVESALTNLQTLLMGIDDRGGRPEQGLLLFVRPRHAEMAAVLNGWLLIKHVDGFVLPKLTLKSLPFWESAVSNPDLFLMPTLETSDVYDPGAMVELGQTLKARLDQRIIVLAEWRERPYGLSWFASQFAHHALQYAHELRDSHARRCDGCPGLCPDCSSIRAALDASSAPEELELDIAHGLVGKTAIHPSQISIIQDMFRVSLEDLNCAKLIVNDLAPAVFKHNDAMCEPATHYKWAVNILDRAKWNGVRPAELGNGEYSVRLVEAN